MHTSRRPVAQPARRETNGSYFPGSALTNCRAAEFMQ
jgi:hypothetical protein